MNAELEHLLQNDPRIWRGQKSSASQPVVPSGFPELDRLLPGGGWPRPALMEISVSDWGIGELRLILPLMRFISGLGRWLIWINPPFEPYAPALRQGELDLDRMLVLDTGSSDLDLWWSMEKLLHHPASSLVMAWPRRIRQLEFRRLQLAAEEGGNIGVVFHREIIDRSSAGLRLSLAPAEPGLEIRILKARRGFGGTAVRVMQHELR